MATLIFLFLTCLLCLPYNAASVLLSLSGNTGGERANGSRSDLPDGWLPPPLSSSTSPPTSSKDLLWVGPLLLVGGSAVLCVVLLAQRHWYLWERRHAVGGEEPRDEEVTRIDISIKYHPPHSP